MLYDYVSQTFERNIYISLTCTDDQLDVFIKEHVIYHPMFDDSMLQNERYLMHPNTGITIKPVIYLPFKQAMRLVSELDINRYDLNDMYNPKLWPVENILLCSFLSFFLSNNITNQLNRGEDPDNYQGFMISIACYGYTL